MTVFVSSFSSIIFCGIPVQVIEYIDSLSDAAISCAFINTLRTIGNARRCSEIGKVSRNYIYASGNDSRCDLRATMFATFDLGTRAYRVIFH